MSSEGAERASKLLNFHVAEAAPQELLLRLSPNWPGSRGGVERWTADTLTWRLVFGMDLDEEAPVAVLPSPAIDTDRTVHVLTHADLWRSTDQGETWERCLREQLDGRQYANWVTAGTLTGNWLLVGARAGEFFAIDVYEGRCKPSGATITKGNPGRP